MHADLAGRPDTQYEDLLRHVMANGAAKSDRTGTGTRSVFGAQLRFPLEQGFPLVTTKRVHFKSVALELLWFLRGDGNVRWLQERGVTIWDEWADADGDLGPVYGVQWRAWPTPDGRHVDQISDAARHPAPRPRLAPDDRVRLERRRDPADGAAPPATRCSSSTSRDGRLSCQLYQRSADLFLGVPFNIASYALLTQMIAQQVGLEPGDFVWTGGDCHIYDNHVEQVTEQLSRDPYPFPRLELRRAASLFDYEYDDLSVARLPAPPGHQGAGGRVSVALIWAQARGGVIGAGNALPWHLPEDQRHFRETTSGGTVVMGRATWQSLPDRFRPLPGRRNVVLTRDAGFVAPGAEVTDDLARGAAPAERGGPVWVIGGAQVYAAALPLADEVVVTEIDLDVDGDAFAPPVAGADWVLVDDRPAATAGTVGERPARTGSGATCAPTAPSRTASPRRPGCRPAPARKTTSSRVPTTRSASSSDREVVVVTARVAIPAARAAASPLGASSTTRHARAATPRRCAPSRNGSGSGLPRVTSSAVTTTCGAISPDAPIRASASGRVHEVTMAARPPGTAAIACEAPGSTTTPVDVLQLELVDPGQGTGQPVLRRSTSRTICCEGTPWNPCSRTGSTSCSSAQVTQLRTTAAVESTSVPSRSNRTAANVRPARAVRGS